MQSMFLKNYLKYGFIFFLSLLLIAGSNNAVYAKKNKESKKIKKIQKELEKEIKKEDTSRKPHSPHKATIYSMILPGLGQAYNRKYWKIPIIYAGIGTMIYFIKQNNSEYHKFKDAYEYVKLEDETLPVPNHYAEIYNLTQLENARDIYRRNLDFSYIITGMWYLLNVVDAVVDAHLFEFEVSEDLSMKVEPDIKLSPNNSKPYTGVRVTFKLPFSKN